MSIIICTFALDFKTNNLNNTTMDYKKIYEERLEKARVFRDHLLETGEKDYAEEMEYIFPEIKEDENVELNPIIKKVVSVITNSLSVPTNTMALGMMLKAYNRYQEDERDGVDYIFNQHNLDDMKCCMDGGMTRQEIADLFAETFLQTTPYFYFGVNYKKPQPINDYTELKAQIIANLEEIIKCVISFPYVEEYQTIYRNFITPIMCENLNG